MRLLLKLTLLQLLLLIISQGHFISSKNNLNTHSALDHHRRQKHKHSWASFMHCKYKRKDCSYFCFSFSHDWGLYSVISLNYDCFSILVLKWLYACRLGLQVKRRNALQLFFFVTYPFKIVRSRRWTLLRCGFPRLAKSSTSRNASFLKHAKSFPNQTCFFTCHADHNPVGPV